MTSDLTKILERSEVLLAEMGAVFAAAADSDQHAELTIASCLVSREHAISVRALLVLGAPTSAATLLRPQLESLTRAMWIMYAADDDWIERLNAIPSLEAEHAAGKVPMQFEMMKQLEGKIPKPAYDMLTSFVDAQLKTLQSFVHVGLHPLARIRTGYSESFLMNLIRCSNALSTMTAMLMANVSNNPNTIQAAKDLPLKYVDCLPPIQKV